jgi:hypothetical protein
MAKRRRKSRSRPIAFVTRLPFRPPFSKEEWGQQRMSEMLDNPKCFDYLQKCVRDIFISDRARTYVWLLTMIAHAGRLPEFGKRSMDKFLEEAKQQHFSESQMATALELILNTSGPGQIMPNAAAAFEFLHFSGDFVKMYGQHIGAGPRLKDLADRVMAMALGAFAVAVNDELGIRKDFWKPNGE